MGRRSQSRPIYCKPVFSGTTARKAIAEIGIEIGWDWRVVMKAVAPRCISAQLKAEALTQVRGTVQADILKEYPGPEYLYFQYRAVALKLDRW